MRRRDFIKGIAASATTWPLAVRAGSPMIGFLHVGTFEARASSNVSYRGMNGLVVDKSLGRKLSVAGAGFLRTAFHISLRA
jgi:hypothetical protein